MSGELTKEKDDLRGDLEKANGRITALETDRDNLSNEVGEVEGEIG